MPGHLRTYVPMLYHAYEARRALTTPVHRLAAIGSQTLRRVPEPWASATPVRSSRAISDTLATWQLTHRRPRFGIESVLIDGEPVAVREETVTATPFGRLQHFAKEIETATPEPRVIVVPGLAGHFATLVRGTIRTLLADHDVFVADWRNARDVPPSAGRFGLDEYIEHLMEFLEATDRPAHLMAVCQPCVAAIAATALMAEDDNPAQPRSLILLAGPVDARINPGPVNRYASKQTAASIERRAIMTVPRPHRGAGRRVYPGFLQISGFMGMDPRRHLSAVAGFARDVAQGNDADAARTKAFYEEYFAVLDIAAEFYLDTARAVFMDHDLACGRLQWRDRLIDPGAIESALMTIEAEKDDMCPPGQTRVAHDLCTGVPAARRVHRLQPGVGHYGVFSGTRFEREIYPEITKFVAGAEATSPVRR